MFGVTIAQWRFQVGAQQTPPSPYLSSTMFFCILFCIRMLQYKAQIARESIWNPGAFWPPPPPYLKILDPPLYLSRKIGNNIYSAWVNVEHFCEYALKLLAIIPAAYSVREISMLHSRFSKQSFFFPYTENSYHHNAQDPIRWTRAFGRRRRQNDIGPGCKRHRQGRSKSSELDGASTEVRKRQWGEWRLRQ